MSDTKPKLLIVDDELGILEMIKEHFELRGFKVFAAGDGIEGIKICETTKPDVIVLDLKMKELDGDKAIPRIKGLVPDAKILVVSAYQDSIMRQRVDGLGVHAYYEKPISILDLERAVRDALA